MLAGVALGACSSPYFNTFYNAEKSFQIAERELQKTRSLSTLSVRELNKAIAKSKKVLNRFGADSTNTYADDALLMIAKASSYLRDYYTSIDAANQLITTFPQSTFASEARAVLWHAYVATNQFDEAGDLMTAIDEATVSPENRVQLDLARAEIHRKRRERNAQIDDLLAAYQHAQQIEDDETRDRLSDDIIDAILTAQAEDGIRSLTTRQTLYFEMKEPVLKQKWYPAFMVLALSDSIPALITGMQNDDVFTGNEEIQAQLERALTLVQRDTFGFYTRYIEDPKKVKKPLDIYQFAVFQDVHRDNLDSALVYYTRSNNQMKDLRVKQSITDRMTQLRQLQQLVRLEQQIRGAGMKSVESLSNDDRIKLADIYYQYANFYLIQTDSITANDYLNQSEQLYSADDPRVVPILLLKAFIQEHHSRALADSLYRNILRRFPDHEKAGPIRDRLGISKRRVESDVYQEYLTKIEPDSVSIAEIQTYMKQMSVDSAHPDYWPFQRLIVYRQLQSEHLDSLDQIRLNELYHASNDEKIKSLLNGYHFIQKAPSKKETSKTLAHKQTENQSKDTTQGVSDNRRETRDKSTAKRTLLDNEERRQFRQSRPANSDVTVFANGRILDYKPLYYYKTIKTTELSVVIDTRGRVKSFKPVTELDPDFYSTVAAICRELRFRVGEEPTEETVKIKLNFGPGGVRGVKYLD